MKPKVTIGMCGRNCADIVGTALDSVDKQDFPHDQMEIVFVDDGSEDNTSRVVSGYLSRIDIAWRVFSEKWEGLGKSRNKIIQRAQGEFIVWVDTDEILTRDFVTKQIELMGQNPDVGIATGRLGILPDENLVLALDLLPSVVEYSRQDWSKMSKLPGTGGATYRVSTAREVGGFDENIEGTGEDVEMASRIKQAGWLILRGEGVFYERHGQLTSWNVLWKRYINHGVHHRRLYLRTNKFFTIVGMNPAASFLASIRYAFHSYRMTKKKIAILLPFHYTFKMTAWFYGFSKRQIRGQSAMKV